MITDKKILAQGLIERSLALKSNKIKEIVSLMGDASTRRYHRIVFEKSKIPSAILMELDPGTKGPVVGGKVVSPNDAFVELSSFFADHGINTPKIYLDARSENLLIVEDVGDVGLWRFAMNDLNEEATIIGDQLGDSATEILYKKSIDVLTTMHSIPYDPEQLVFQRFLQFEHFRADAAEFVQYFLIPKGVKKSAIEVIDQLLDSLCEVIVSHPKVVSHRDFMSWNLHVDRAGTIRVIDYQDAFYSSYTRDIVSLINDRGVDVGLGDKLYRLLLDYAREKLGSKDPIKFDLHYLESLLFWDLRVVGRFHLLCERKKTDHYMQWVPGTLRRLGQTLPKVQKNFDKAGDALEIVTKISPEAREGASIKL